MARSTIILVIVLCGCAAQPAVAQTDSEVRAALAPLPADLRVGAGVFLEVSEGQFERVRDSKNGTSCLRRIGQTDGVRVGFDARCYSDLFWPAIFHRWSLDGHSNDRPDLNSEMHREIESGRITLPDFPTAGYRIMGLLSDFDMESGEPGPRMNKWQSIHFPFFTAKELGLTELEEEVRPGEPGLMPYVMASGTWWSHVMIVHR
jgi:hypothetical protein